MAIWLSASIGFLSFITSAKTSSYKEFFLLSILVLLVDEYWSGSSISNSFASLSNGLYYFGGDGETFL